VETAALLLAAGGGSRFKGTDPKLLSWLAGKPLIWFSLSSALAAAPEALIVVTGALDLAAQAEKLGRMQREAIEELIDHPAVIEQPNPRWQEGMASSLSVGVEKARELGAQAVAVALGDQPLVPPSAWSALLSCPAPLAMAGYGARRGHPVRIGRKYWDELPRTGDTGAKALLSRHQEDVVVVRIEGVEEMALLDVDTEEDLQTAEACLTGRDS